MAKRFKVQEFQDIYNARWFGLYWGAYVWRKAFGDKSKLPQEGRIKTIISDDGQHKVLLHLAPAGKKYDRSHRVFVVCPICKNHIPAGRIHQHTC